MRLEGRIAVITGGASGVGRAIAMLFAAKGAAVVIADISEKDKLGGQAVHNTITASGGEALYCCCDVSNEQHVERLAQDTLSRFGKIDILVNNAGVLCATGLLDTTLSSWERTLAINLTGPFLASRRIAKEMIARNYGRIINVSSIFGMLGHVSSTAYIASKGGLISLTRQMACELGKYKITVNAILPSTVRTGFFKEQRLIDPDSMVPAGDLFDAERLERLKRRAPLGEIAEPEDVAVAALFLASDDAKLVSGMCLPVDGGVMAGRLD